MAGMAIDGKDKINKKPEQQEEAAPAEPGDNPNKQKAVKRKSTNSGPKNAEISTKSILESTDPTPPTMGLIETQGVVDALSPGHPYIGKVWLRIDFVPELITLVQSMVDSTQGLLHRRIDFPNIGHMSGFMVAYSLALQLFNSLTLNSSDGVFRKMKALRLGSVTVPDFLIPLIQCFGNYTTQEGLMRVSAIEQFIPYCVEKALHAYNQLEGRRPLADYQPIESVICVYDSVNYREDFIDLVEMVNPDLFTGFDFQVGDNTIRVDIDMRDAPIESIRDFLDLDQLDVDNPVLIRLRAFAQLRDLTFAQAAAPNLRASFVALGLRHGSTRTIEQLADWLNIATPEYMRICARAVGMLFKSSPFVPSSGGTAAQLMTSRGGVDSAQASHDFALAPTSAALGFILQPALRVEYRSEYIMFSRRSRYQMMMAIADKFVNPNLQ